MTQATAVTPLTDWHRSHGARMAPFAGYDMPVHYGSILGEHQTCRTAATLFDVSHMGRLRIEGHSAGAFLDHVLTRRASDMMPGQVRYGLVCNAEGNVLDDVLTYRISIPSGNDYYLLVVNASNRSKLLKWFEPHLADFPDVTLSDRTSITGMIAIQGPKALEIAGPLLRGRPAKLKRYHVEVTEQFGKPVIVSRTGYTGEDGLELIVRGDETKRIWENLLLAGRSEGIQAAGLGARDTLRLEAGMPLYGHELGEDIDPLSAQLEFACNPQGSFIGSDALHNIRKAGGPPMVRVGLKLEGPRPAREGNPILESNGTPVGRVTSGTVSPTLGQPIAMAYVPRSMAPLGTTVHVDIRGQSSPATVVSLPFVTPQTPRSK